MKTIALEQVDPRIAEALKQQPREDPILLTKGSDALGLLLRLPEGTKNVDAVVWLEEEGLVLIQAKYSPDSGAVGQLVFGSCKHMLTIVSEDDEHLKDFEEYLK